MSFKERFMKEVKVENIVLDTDDGCEYLYIEHPIMKEIHEELEGEELEEMEEFIEEYISMNSPHQIQYPD
jgi:hypothetical protein